MKYLFTFGLLTVSALSADFTIGWTTNADWPVLSGYRVYTTGPTNISVTPSSIPQAKISNLVSGVQYKFEVTAVSASGLESDLSKPLYWVPPVIPTPGPVRSVSFLFSGPGKFSATFSWPMVAMSNFLGYRMKWGVDTNSMLTVNTTGTSATVSGATNGVPYLLSVEALDTFGNRSEPSEYYSFRNDFSAITNVRRTTQTFTSPSQVP